MSGSTGLIVPISVFFGYSKLHLLVQLSELLGAFAQGEAGRFGTGPMFSGP